MAKDKGDNVVKLDTLTRVKLLDAMDTLSRLKTAAASEQGAIGPMMKKFEEDYGCPKAVLGLVSKMDRMSEDKRRDFVRGLTMVLPLLEERLEMSDLFGKGAPPVNEKKAPFAPGPKAGTAAKKGTAAKEKATA